MIKRYFHALSSSVYTNFISNTETGSTIQTATYDTVIKGTPLATVTFTVTNYIASSPGSAVFKVDGTTYVLSNTFTKVLDSTGLVTIVQFIDIGTSSPGNGISVTITITGVSTGKIGIHNSQQNSRVITS